MLCQMTGTCCLDSLDRGERSISLEGAEADSCQSAEALESQVS